MDMMIGQGVQLCCVISFDIVCVVCCSGLRNFFIICFVVCCCVLLLMFIVVMICLCWLWIGVDSDISFILSFWLIMVQFCWCICVIVVFSLLMLVIVCGVCVWMVFCVSVLLSVVLLSVDSSMWFIDVQYVGSWLLIDRLIVMILWVGMCSMQMILVWLSIVVEQFLWICVDSCFIIGLVRFQNGIDVRYVKLSLRIFGVSWNSWLLVLMQLSVCSVSRIWCVFVCVRLVVDVILVSVCFGCVVLNVWIIVRLCVNDCIQELLGFV